MFTPQKMGWPGWSPASAEKKGKGKFLVTTETRSEAASPVKGLIERAVTTTTSASTLEDNGEPEIWRRFKEAGALDEISIEKKDRAALMAHISSLEAELYDYQYNMGVLLMERKEWNLKTEKLKTVVQDAEENWRKDLAAHLQGLSEAEKREESLKKALAIEKQCVSDLEKALKDMRSDSAELKVSAESRIAEARDIVAGTEEKALLAESKLHTADALQAEVRRQLGVAERKLQEAEAREDALRRERLSFKTEQEVHEVELSRQRETLLQWEKKLQEGQDRVLDGQKLLNQREDFTNQRDEALKKIEMDLQDTKKQLDKERVALQEAETNLNSKVSSLNYREESAIKREISIDKREQELLLLQEKVSSRERLLEQREDHLKESEGFLAKERERIEALEKALILKEEALPEQLKDLIELQRTIDHQKAELEVKKADCKFALQELKSERKLLAEEKEELEKNKFRFLELENEHIVNKERVAKLEQQVDKKVEKQLEKEKEIEGKMKAVKDKERALKAEEKQLEGQRKMHEEDKENAKLLLQDIQDLKNSVDFQKGQLAREEEKLRVTEQEREDLLNLQRCLKEEIDDCRARAKAIALEAEELKKEKERFEKEWDILDEKRDEVKRELERADDEARRVAKWLRDEEARLREEKRILREQIQKESEALGFEKEEFTHTVEKERAEWFASVEKERESLVKDLDIKRREMENSIEKRVTEIEKQRKDKDMRIKKEAEQEKEKIEALKDLAEKKMEEVLQEKLKLDKERVEIAKLREECGKEWLEIKKDIDELQVQREKLREQREALIKERDETVQEADKLRKLKGEQTAGDGSLELPHGDEVAVMTPKVRHRASMSKQEATPSQGILTPAPSIGQLTPENLVLGTPSRLSWLRKCVSGLFLSPDGKPETFIFKGAAKEGSKESKLPLKLSPTHVDNNEGPDADLGLEEQQQSSDSFTDRNYKAELLGQRGRGKGSQRTRSVHAVVDNSKAIPQPLSVDEVMVEVPKQSDRDEELLEDDEHPVEESAAGDKGVDAVPTSRSRKRQHAAIETGTDAGSQEDMEAGAEILTIGLKRKRHQGVSDTPNIELGKESPRVKRYNFRRSTITKLGPPKMIDQSQAPDASKEKILPEKTTMNAQAADEDWAGSTIEIVLHEQVDMTTATDKNVLGSESAGIDVGVEEAAGNGEGQKGPENMETVVAVENGGGLENEGKEADIAEDEEEVAEYVAEAAVNAADVPKDDADSDAKASDNMEQLDADEGEENGQVVDLEGEEAEDDTGGDIDADEDEEDEVVEERTLKQKWWDYLTT